MYVKGPQGSRSQPQLISLARLFFECIFKGVVLHQSWFLMLVSSKAIFIWSVRQVYKYFWKKKKQKTKKQFYIFRWRHTVWRLKEVILETHCRFRARSVVFVFFIAGNAMTCAESLPSGEKRLCQAAFRVWFCFRLVHAIFVPQQLGLLRRAQRTVEKL